MVEPFAHGIVRRVWTSLLVAIQVEGEAALLAHEVRNRFFGRFDIVPTAVLHPEDLRVEGDRCVEVLDANSRVFELRLHRLNYRCQGREEIDRHSAVERDSPVSAT